jgi:hypothetical protein
MILAFGDVNARLQSDLLDSVQSGCSEAVPPGASKDLFLTSLPSHPYSSRSNRHRRPLKPSRKVMEQCYLTLERMVERFKGYRKPLRLDASRLWRTSRPLLGTSNSGGNKDSYL